MPLEKTKTKIVCTLTGKHADEKFIKQMIKNGMNVVRLNFSHMNIKQANRIIEIIAEVRAEINEPISIMLDTKGPEVRLYGFDKEVEIKKDDLITIQSYDGEDIESIESEKERYFYTNLPDVGKLTKEGGKILLMDGFVEGRIIDKENDRIIVEIKNNALLRPKAHLSIPKLDYPLPFLAPKDVEDIKYAVERDLDYLALSFVRSTEDISKVKSLVREINPESQIKIISKIENRKALDNLNEIIRYSDGIMVARGDLGVELDLQDVPVVQKDIIEKCYLSGKPVITATQMLESMVDNPIPTRAEASDVANAGYDMTSAVMLSSETAIGKYPLKVVETMKNILLKVENAIEYENVLRKRKEIFQSRDLTSIISYNAISTSYQSNSAALIVFTKTGYSARMISKLRPKLPIYAFTFKRKVFNQLALNWGVFPFMLKEKDDFEAMLSDALDLCLKENLVNRGDLAVIIAGLPLGGSGRTNNIRIESLGKSRIPGKLIHEGDVTAPVVHIYNENDISEKKLTGKILFLKNFKKEYIAYLRYVSGIGMENDDYEKDLQLIGMTYNIPVFLNAYAVMDMIEEGTVVEINSKKQLLIEI